MDGGEPEAIVQAPRPHTGPEAAMPAHRPSPGATIQAPRPPCRPRGRHAGPQAKPRGHHTGPEATIQVQSPPYRARVQVQWPPYRPEHSPLAHRVAPLWRAGRSERKRCLIDRSRPHQSITPLVGGIQRRDHCTRDPFSRQHMLCVQCEDQHVITNM